VIEGRVTSGWLKGSHVEGKYLVEPVCAIPTPGNALDTTCFAGSLQIVRGSRH
jgi:hypothetical protein